MCTDFAILQIRVTSLVKNGQKVCFKLHDLRQQEFNEMQIRLNTFTANDDCSRFYRSLPKTTIVVNLIKLITGYSAIKSISYDIKHAEILKKKL